LSFVYRAVRATLRLGLRAWFREIEVHGIENVPAEGPILVVANHHNSMIDPFLVIAAVERPVSFIAKAPLFRVPGLGTILRALLCIPAHRSQDPGYAREKNEGLYGAACALLGRGGAVGICPEGKTHDDPTLAEFKHGAAKIAFEAEQNRPGVRLQLVGIHFEVTRGFRGKALLQFGPPVTLDAYRERLAEDPRAAVGALTSDLHAKLSEMLLLAENEETIRLADLLERMASLDAGAAPDLKKVFDRKKRFLERYGELRRTEPLEVEQLREGLRHYRRTLDLLGVRDDQVAQDYRAGRALRFALRNTLGLLAGLPFVALGILCNIVPYLLCWTLSRLFTRTRDLQAGVSFSLAVAFFPAAWAALGYAAWRIAGIPAGVAALVAAPVTGAIALAWMDRWHRVLGETWGLWTALALPAARAQLRRLRERTLARFRRLAAGAKP
jgi:1-acyl-sn-glycerol-3-phosphate acyltransferase